MANPGDRLGRAGPGPQSGSLPASADRSRMADWLDQSTSGADQSNSGGTMTQRSSMPTAIVMETAEWLPAFADPAVRDKLSGMGLEGAGAGAAKMMAELPDLWAGHKDLEIDAEVIKGPKGWHAPGALDTEVRSRVLDALGIDAQLVFPTFSLGHFARSRDLDVLYGGTRALDRAMLAFCAADPRLQGGRLPPVERSGAAPPTRSTKPSPRASPPSGCRRTRRRTSRPRTSTSTRSGPAWPRPDVPFVLHVGGGKLLPKAFHNNGLPRPKDWLGGGENLRAKDFPVLHHSPERFLACLAIDGVFERHPDLRGAAIELGATWVPGMLRNLDHAHRSFAKFEPAAAGARRCCRRSTSAAR